VVRVRSGWIPSDVVTWRVDVGDCIEKMRELPPASVDAVVTDPPYGLSEEPNAEEVIRHWLAGDDYKHRGGGFMGKSWDSFVPGPAYWRECWRVLKPGGYLLSFGGTRTYDMLGLAIRLAKFEIRDCTLYWGYGTGFPKSLNVAKAIDGAAGVQGGRGPMKRGGDRLMVQAPDGKRDGEGRWGDESGRDAFTYEPESDDAKRWNGWHTALKPGYEPVVVARKALAGTVADNVLRYGTGAIDVDACRIGMSGEDREKFAAGRRAWAERDERLAEGRKVADVYGTYGPTQVAEAHANGRWPANVILCHTPLCVMVGTTRVRAGDPGDVDAQTSDSTVNAYGKFEKRSAVTHAEDDGMEEVEVWDCPDGCAVRMLNEQAGKRSAGAYPAARSGRGSEKVYGSGWSTGTIGERVDTGDGAASRFYYTAKASRLEREAGLAKRACTCEAVPEWDSADQPVATPPEREVSPQRDITASTATGVSGSCTTGCGSSGTDVSPTGTTCITSTETSSTTDTITSGSLQLPITSEYTLRTFDDPPQDNGSVVAASVASGSEPKPTTTTSADKAGCSTGDAENVTSESSLSRSVCERCGGVVGSRVANSHPT
jgi:hypothetical protein